MINTLGLFFSAFGILSGFVHIGIGTFAGESFDYGRISLGFVFLLINGMVFAVLLALRNSRS